MGAIKTLILFQRGFVDLRFFANVDVMAHQSCPEK
jgi:hypothetical protein